MKGVWKERDKKRDILSSLTNQREREKEVGGVYKAARPSAQK